MTWETRKAHGPSCIDPVEVGLGLKGATRERERETYPSSGRNFKNSPALTHGLSFPPLREPCLSFLLSLKLHPSNAIEIRTTIKMREKRGEEIELVKRKEKKKSSAQLFLVWNTRSFARGLENCARVAQQEGERLS